MYIDPGAGSIVIQALSAAAIGFLASLSRVRRYVGKLVARRKR